MKILESIWAIAIKTDRRTKLV